ncbi:MAG TPA: LacI family DNA-binding transcriptional regulator [Solirubrobacteraceae bacterium]|nr:LacI family DNA-binding transcriptional regulator [Solirubrobacteraceae bacterium]
MAREAGVHPGTVSRVLNPAHRHLISEQTASRVERVARALGYETNQIARGLRMRQSFTVGVLIPDLTNPLFPPMVRGIEDHLHPFGYTALLTNTDADPQRELRGLEALSARQVDGFIIAPTATNVGNVKELIANGVPIVLINRSISGVQSFAVTPDDRRGASAAVEHLVALGHRAIAHVGGPQTLSPGQDRWRGYAEAMREHGLEDETKKLVAFADGFIGGAGVEPTRDLLARGEPFTAVSAANDLIALDCIDVLREAGLRCPRDVSVIGFNDMPYAHRFDPPLTTIRFSHYEMGHRAAELLIGQIRGDTSAPRTIVLSTELVERCSTAAPPA